MSARKGSGDWYWNVLGAHDSALVGALKVQSVKPRSAEYCQPNKHGNVFMLETCTQTIFKICLHFQCMCCIFLRETQFLVLTLKFFVYVLYCGTSMFSLLVHVDLRLGNTLIWS